MSDPAPELVHLDVDRGVATITLDSPANRNALSTQFRRELGALLEAAVDDNAVRVVVLTHTGAVFCAGMDLKESHGTGAQRHGVDELPAILERIWTSPKPVVRPAGRFGPSGRRRPGGRV